MLRDRVRLFLSLLTLAIHLAVANRYDFFRDELYFIVCGRHPAFGYVDQPPLVPLLSALTQVAGEHLFLLRALSSCAAAATVFVTVTLARTFGAHTFGALLAGTAAALAPMYLGLMTTVGTTTFEPFLWALLALLLTRAVVTPAPHLFVWAGLVAGIDLELKYELPIYLLPLLGALLVSGHARALRGRPFVIGAALLVVIAAPSVIWQGLHGWPFVELLHNQRAEGKNVSLGPIAFIGQQLLVMNPLFAPVWLAGAIAPWRMPRLRAARPLSLAFAIAFLAMLVLHAKDYYVAPLYGPMFAVGGVALESLVANRAVRAIHLGAAVLVSVVVSPLALPLLSPPALVAYQQAIHLQARSAETSKQSPLPQTFADMFGWREMTAKMTEAVNQLTPEERARTVILGHNYGEAAAFEFYGRGLPPVVAGHNQYSVWGPTGPEHGPEPTLVIAFNRDETELVKRCAEARELSHFYAPWVMPFEDDSAITLCRQPTPSLTEQWPSLRFIL